MSPYCRTELDLTREINSSNPLAAALQQHPQYSLRAIEAAMRRLATTAAVQTQHMGFRLQYVAADLPSAAWFVGSVSSPQFWSGAESDDLAVHVASLLRTCFQLNGRYEYSDGNTVAEQMTHLIVYGPQLSAIQSYAHAAWMEAGTGSSSSNSSSNISGSSSRSRNSKIVQLSSYTEPCPQPLLRIASLLLMQYGQALAMLQTAAPYAAPCHAHTYCCDNLAQSLFDCLGYMRWLGPQLQQLLLPGDPRKAAAALQDLQEQQQQLQQELEASLWRLHKVAPIIGPDDKQLQQESVMNAIKAAARQLHMKVAALGDKCKVDEELLEQLAESSSSSNGAHLEALPVPDVDVDALASSRPDIPIRLDDLDPARLLFVHPAIVEKAAALVGAELPQQLQQFGSALWSALPQLRCCNNAACANLGSISEAKLVAGRASRCSKCKAAK
jgi:hypothetical protein